MNIDAHVSPGNLESFMRVLRKAENAGYKTPKKAVMWGAIQFATSARSRTPVGQDRRPVVSNPKFRHLMRKEQYKAERIKGRDMSAYYQYSASKLRQNKEPRELLANKPDGIGKIGNRGIARDSWALMLSWLGRRAAIKSAGSAQKARRHIQVGKQLSGANPSVRLTNFLSYIEKIAPGIVDISIDAAAKRMEYLIDKNLKKATA